MPLDSHAKRVLALIGAAAGIERRGLTAVAQRDAMTQLARTVDAKNIPIGAIEHREISSVGSPCTVRVYTPCDAAGEFAGIVYFHGGMGVTGTLDTHEGLCRLLANASGCRVLAVDYRLAPEFPFPSGLDDARLAVEWTFQHARELGLDARRVAVAGDSAGGTLAAVTCRLACERGDKRIALQVLLCPVTDLGATSDSWRQFGAGYFVERDAFLWARSQYAPANADLSDPRLSPLRARDFSLLPPAHVHTAELDPFLDEGRAYADALAAAGVPVRYVCHAGMIHHFYCMAGVIPAAQRIIGEIGAGVRDALATA